MKRRNRIVGMLAISAMALAFTPIGLSKWTSSAAISGSVEAQGNWDVFIEDAAVTGLSSAGCQELPKEPASMEIVAYNVYAQRRLYWGEYHYFAVIDDLNPIVKTVTLDELKNLADNTVSIRATWANINHFKSGLRIISGPAITFQADWSQTALDLGFSEGTAYVKAPEGDEGSFKDAWLGTFVCSRVSDKTGQNPWKLVEQYNTAFAALEGQQGPVLAKAEISEDGQNAVLPDLSFSLPGAWAQVTFTIKNNGTARANLNKALFQLTEQTDQVVLDFPDFPENEALEPGQSCTVTATVMANPDWKEDLSWQGSLSIRLSYIQDEVEPAPDPAHVH